jgi:hypothetical protein
MQDSLDAFKDQVFYWEARRIRDEQRRQFCAQLDRSRHTPVAIHIGGVSDPNRLLIRSPHAEATIPVCVSASLISARIDQHYR